MNSPLLSLRDISVSINGLRILSDICLDIHRRLVTTIIGPSGSGKTTLLRTINLLRRPTGGRIIFNDQVIFDARSVIGGPTPGLGHFFLNGFSDTFKSSGIADSDYRRHFGMVFQDYNLWPNLTLYDNIAAPLRWSLHLDEGEIRRRIEDHANIVKISHILHKYPTETSGGERQRAAIARALVTEPDILLLDEITSALDVELASEILKLVLLLKERGHTMILVTHHLHFAERISDVVVFLTKGRIIETGQSPQIFAMSKTPELRQFLEFLKF
jgi:polar amino acid transport system ATP-binding protein